MSTFVVFKEKLTCVYNDVIKVNNSLHFYRYYDNAHYVKIPHNIIKANSLKGFLNKCQRHDVGYVYLLVKHQLHYHGMLDRWKFISNEK